MIKITLKDGSVKELAAPQSIADFTKDLSMGLYRNACCALVDGKVADLCDLLDHDCAVEILTFEDEQGQRAFNHTASHILAQAVQHLFPGAKLAIGPAIEDGFYYDFDVPSPFTPEDLEKLEAEMAAIAKQDLPIERFSVLPFMLRRGWYLSCIETFSNFHRTQTFNAPFKDSFYRCTDIFIH